MWLDPGLDHTARDTHPTIDARIEALGARFATDELVECEVTAITRSLGFDSFSYVTSVPGTHRGRAVDEDASAESLDRSYMWTTLPQEWMTRYERMRYAEVDPRLTHTWNRTMPYLWDAARSSTEWQVQQFLRDAARFGICSGAVVSFRDSNHARIVVALNSRVSPVTAERQAQIHHLLGEVMLLATSFHDLFMQRVHRARASAHVSQTRLSPRERQCLQMAARGLTSADIGTKLGITERTANFHFSNLITKLGVLNRHEAIARAVSTGIISVGGND